MLCLRVVMIARRDPPNAQAQAQTPCWRIRLWVANFTRRATSDRCVRVCMCMSVGTTTNHQQTNQFSARCGYFHSMPHMRAALTDRGHKVRARAWPIGRMMQTRYMLYTLCSIGINLAVAKALYVCLTWVSVLFVVNYR